jgi:outer membrane protein
MMTMRCSYGVRRGGGPLPGGVFLAGVLLAGSLAAGGEPGPAVPAGSNGTLRLRVAEGVLMALENNPSLRTQRLATDVVRSREEDARAVFDPSLSGSLSRSRREAPGRVLQSGSASDDPVTQDHTTGEAALAATLPTGTRIELGGRTEVSHPVDNATASRAGIDLTQPLLNGFGTGPNLARLRQARLDTRVSVHEFRAFALALVAGVERAAWNDVLAHSQIEAYRESLRLAEQQLAETRERIRVGKLARLEEVAAEAEVALRREGLIDAESQRATARVRLIRLLNPSQPDPWRSDLLILDDPVPPESPLEAVETYVRTALDRRPDINQARLGIERGDLELVRTRNGLLPRMDLFVTLGRSGYASSFQDSTQGEDGRGYDTLVGVRLDYPLINRGARAEHRRATLSREQAASALANLCQLAQEDVRTAWVEAERTREQVAAKRATLALQQRKLEAETTKFREGKSTTLLVAQAERDLLTSRIDVIRFTIAAITARTDLYRLDGSLLDRRGIAVDDE